MRCRWLLGAALVVAQPAAAQRADDNAVTAAGDAFGINISGESIGIYNPSNVRGFSAVDAGNIRLEGLYYDQQTSLTDRLVQGSTMRVGLSAQSYPFPAPTGIADYSLRLPGDRRIVSTMLRFGPYDSLTGEIDAQLPIVEGKLSLGVGTGYYRERTVWGSDPIYWSKAIIARWKPIDGVEIVPFWSHISYDSEEPQPLIFAGGEYLPPRIERVRYTGQPWAENEGGNSNYGLLGSADIGDWTLRAGVFRSLAASDRSYSTLFLDTQPDGTAQQVVIAERDRRFGSVSGEVRLSRTLREGPRQHVVHLSARGRERKRRYGGGDTVVLGTSNIGEQTVFAEPGFEFSEQTRDRVEQWTLGIAYEGRWRDVGELSFGVQKTDYRKSIAVPGEARPDSTGNPWLLNGTLALYVSDSIAIYGGYTRGLEESPVAPDVARNKDEAPPAIRTEQADAGVRWAVRPNLTFVAGVFDVRKPYYNLDETSLFTKLGELRHRGVELSLSGRVAKGLSAVIGTWLLDAEVSGEAVERGLIGKKPVASIARYTNASIEYRPPAFDAFSVDVAFESSSDRVANRQNTVEIPARSVVALGTRYRFKLGEAPAMIRAQVSNIFNNFGWSNGGSGFYVYNQPRRFTLSLTADF